MVESGAVVVKLLLSKVSSQDLSNFEYLYIYLSIYVALLHICSF